MPSESSQVRSAQQGDEAAFAALITAATPLLYNTAWRLLHNEADVADVLQETTINAWQHLPQLRQPRYFTTWLYRILLNEVHRFWREEKPHADLSEISPAAAEPLATDTISALVQQLPPELQEVIVLYYYGGFSTKEIAAVLQRPPATIRTQMRRGRMQLKAWLTTQEGETNHDQA